MSSDVSGRELPVGRRIDDDDVRTTAAKDDETDGGRFCVREKKCAPVDLLLIKQSNTPIAESIPADLTKESRSRAESRRARCHVGALAAVRRVKILADHRLAFERDRRHVHNQCSDIAPHDGDCTHKDVCTPGFSALARMLSTKSVSSATSSGRAVFTTALTISPQRSRIC